MPERAERLHTPGSGGPDPRIRTIAAPAAGEDRSRSWAENGSDGPFTIADPARTNPQTVPMTLLRSIRVLLAADGLAADLLERRLREDADFDVVGRVEAVSALPAAQRYDPDFVVIPLGGPLDRETVELLEAVPRMRVLSLQIDRGRAFLTELLDDVAPDDLADALRRAAHGRAA